MKIKSKILLIHFILISNIIFSQDTNIVKYFPLAVGNVWFYNGNAVIGGMGCFSSYFYDKISIDSSKIFNGKVYFKFNVQKLLISGQGCGYSFIENGKYYRVDSLSGNIYKYSPGYIECPLRLYEGLVDSLNGRVRDTSYSCSGGIYYPYKGLSDTSDYSFLNLSLKSKKFFGPVNGLDYFYDNTYSKNFGLVNYGNTGPGIYSRCALKGCIIGGVVYGDTGFIIGVHQISSEVPNQFELHQNYPNPFNPATQIKFNIPKSSYIILAIYDAVGNEISVLVNENLQAGGYSVDWDATNNPSGIYFYKITSEAYSETKKMVLIK